MTSSDAAMTAATTDSGAAHPSDDSHPTVGGTGPYSRDAHRTLDGHTAPGVAGPSLADPAQRGSARQRYNGGVGDPSTVSAQRSAESHSDRGVDGPTPTDPPIGNPAAMLAAAGPSASTPPGVPIEDTAALRALARPEVQTPPATPIASSTAMASTASLADPTLALAADVLDDLERVRIANENRLRQLTRDETDSDGEERGFGLDESHPDVARLAALVDALAKNEHQATLNLSRQMRAHPLGPWVKRTVGVGEKQAARLIASIGDPAWHAQELRPRTVRELYSYCGYGDATAQVRVRGQRSNWDPAAKMRAHLIAASCVKQAASPYRVVYDEARVKYDGALHPGECKRCGPAGKPAQPGSPLSLGHQHARALRLVAKAVLRDLWREARRLRGEDSDDDPWTTKAVATAR